MKIKVKNDKPKTICQYCLSPDLTGKPVIICDRCQAITHEQCIKENNGCPTPGCAKSMKMPAKTAPAPVHATQVTVPVYRPSLKERWSDFEMRHRSAADFTKYLVISSLIGVTLGVMAVCVKMIYFTGGVLTAFLGACLFAVIPIIIARFMYNHVKRSNG